MRGDFTRLTNDPTRHYTHVLYQQGRVALDADPNEQAFINDELRRAAIKSIIGLTGAPSDEPGFGIGAAPDGTITFSKGKFYVDGILCENADNPGDYLSQSDLPARNANEKFYPGFVQVSPPTGGSPQTDLVYLDVWQRFITAIEDPDIRDPALGGPDTATRLRTIAQVKLIQNVKATHCDDTIPDWNRLIGRVPGNLTARAPVPDQPPDPCRVVAGGGYMGLENRLYRVEIHGEGEPLTPRPTGNASTAVGIASVSGATVTLSAWDTGMQPWMPGQRVEVYQDGVDGGFLATVVSVGAGQLTLTFDSASEVLPTGVNLLIRRIATWKWSRDNGSIVYPIEAFVAGSPTRARLETMGRDTILHLGAGDQVEVSDSIADLYGYPGTIGTITDPIDESREVGLGVDVSSYDRDARPRLRRWDRGPGQTDVLQEVECDTPSNLEDGVQVTFTNPGGNVLFASGDWWAFWARARTHTVEPFEARPPMGVEHHYARLALITWSGNTHDNPHVLVCRPVFPSLTELTNLSYLGGDGQEGGPGSVLPYPLRVGVAAGDLPVASAVIRFHVVEGGGSLAGATGTPPDTLLVPTGADGEAECRWQLGPTPNQNQRVQANLIGPGGAIVPLTVQFAALCQTPMTGGGCTVALGPTDPLQDSIQALLQGRTAVRICLLPGDYHLGGLTIDGAGLTPLPNLRIEGCGSRSRILLDPQGKILLQNLSEVELAHLDISGGSLGTPNTADSLLDIKSCDSAVVESSRVFHLTQGVGPSAVRVSGVPYVRVEEDHVESRSSLKKRFPKVPIAGIDLNVVNALMGYSGPDLQIAMGRAADAILQQASLTAGTGVAINPQADGGRPGREALRTMRKQAQQPVEMAPVAGAPTAAVDRTAVLGALQQLVDAMMILPKGNALAIGDNSSATVARSTVVGTVTLYGDPPPGQDLLPLPLRRRLEKNKPQFGAPRGELRMERNDLTRMDISETATHAILAAAEGESGAGFNAPYRACFLEENVFEPDDRRSYIVAKHIAMASNTFQRVDGGNVGTLIADTIAFVGNHSLEPACTLEYVARVPAQAANITVNIVPP